MRSIGIAGGRWGLWSCGEEFRFCKSFKGTLLKTHQEPRYSIEVATFALSNKVKRGGDYIFTLDKRKLRNLYVN